MGSLISQAYAKTVAKDEDDDGGDDTCPTCGAKRVESIAPEKPTTPTDTVALKQRMTDDTKQGMKQRDDALFYNRLEVGSTAGSDRAKNRRASDDAQAGLNRTAATYQARSDTLAAARSKKRGGK